MSLKIGKKIIGGGGGGVGENAPKLIMNFDIVKKIPQTLLTFQICILFAYKH